MIVLIGFMGAGKTTVGRRLAEALDIPFVDSDEALVARVGRSVPAIFAEDGEAAFRALEHETIAALLGGDRTVLAVGGGAVESAQTARLLGDHPVVLLHVDYAEALRRTGADGNRPMLQRADLAEVYRARQITYRSVASIVVDTVGRDLDEVTNEVLTQLGLSSET